MFRDGEHTAPDPQRRLRALTIACKRNNLRACASIASIYDSGDKSIAANRERAITFWALACPPTGHIFVATACERLGIALHAGGKHDDALQAFIRLCSSMGKSCTTAASIASELALGKLQRQCKAGDGVACGELAPRLLERGCLSDAKESCQKLEALHPDRARTLWGRRCAVAPLQGRQPCMYRLPAPRRKLAQVIGKVAKTVRARGFLPPAWDRSRPPGYYPFDNNGGHPMPNTIACANCSNPTENSAAEYSPAGELVCADCAMSANIERSLQEAENTKGTRGGLIDRAFLSHLSPTGKKMYWIGQLLSIGVLAAVLFGATDLRIDEAQWYLLGGALGIIVVWGFVCLAIWPKRIM